jgi:hypothetical protein
VRVEERRARSKALIDPEVLERSKALREEEFTAGLPVSPHVHPDTTVPENRLSPPLAPLGRGLGRGVRRLECYNQAYSHTAPTLSKNSPPSKDLNTPFVLRFSKDEEITA